MALKSDHTLQGHSGLRAWNPYEHPWCPGAWTQPWFKVGDLVANDHNDTVGIVESIEVIPDEIQGLRQRMTVRKTAGTQGHAKVGETFPESNHEVHLVEYAKAG